jgi:hypothetical protein
MVELCQYSDVLDYPGFVDMSPENMAWIGRLIKMFSGLTETLTGRDLEKKARTIQVSLDYDTSAMQLRAYGLSTSAITSINQDNDRLWPSGNVVDSTDYYFDTDTGIVHKDYGTWRTGRGVIRVIYDAGMATTTEDVPEDLRSAAVMQVASWWQHRDELGLERREFGSSQVSVQKSDTLLPQVREIIEYYSIP